jgi:hypothetical protein
MQERIKSFKNSTNQINSSKMDEEKKPEWYQTNSTIINVSNETDEESTPSQEWFSNSESSKQTFEDVQVINSKPQPSIPLNILEEGINSNYGFVAQTVLSNAYSSASNSNWFQFTFLQPYFQIDEKEVLRRLLSTLKPNPMNSILKKPDFYGPIMSYFTLVTILVLSLKTGAYQFAASSEGSLLGQCLFICFIFWSLISAVCFFLFFLNDIPISISQTISITGYQLFSISLVHFPNILNISSFYVFIFLLASIGSLSILSLIKTLSGLDERKKKISLGISILICVIQLAFQFYIRFHYASVDINVTQIVTKEPK